MDTVPSPDLSTALARLRDASFTTNQSAVARRASAMQIIADSILACVRSLVEHSTTLGFPLSLHFDTANLTEQEQELVAQRFGEQTWVRQGVEYAGLAQYRDQIVKVGSTSGRCAGRKLIFVVTSQCLDGEIGVVAIATLSTLSQETLSQVFAADEVLAGQIMDIYQLSHDALKDFVDRLAQDLS